MCSKALRAPTELCPIPHHAHVAKRKLLCSAKPWETPTSQTHEARNVARASSIFNKHVPVIYDLPGAQPVGSRVHDDRLRIRRSKSC